MKVLLLGSKEYPFHSSKNFDESPGGGIEIYIEKLSKFLTKREIKTFLITRYFPNQKKIEKNNLFQVDRVRYINNKFLRNFSFNFLSFFKAINLIKKEKIDLFHCNGPVSGFFGSMLKIVTKKKFIYTPHGSTTGWSFPIRYILNFFHLLSIKKADYVIFVSEIAQNEFKSKCIGKSILLKNSIDLNSLHFKEKYTRTFFGFLGRLEKIKGLELILDSFKIVLKKYPEIKIKIGGEGTLKEYLINFMKENNLMGNIIYVGWVKNPYSFFKSIDCFVFPSNEKGHPITLLESLSVGNIVLTSLPYVTDGYDGITCKREVEDISEKMIFIIQNKHKLKNIKKNAIENIKKFYSWDKRIDEIIDVYRLVM